ncbi:MAG: DUF4097 family beta strand repeat protein [Clostridiales bacterium]|nr:DUF4097 family beta strand repeat protein [Clostridiales bacterium]
MIIKDEVKYILKMLEEGRITSDQAAKLIDAIDINESADKINYSAITEVVTSMAEMSKRLGKIGAQISKDIVEEFVEIDAKREKKTVEKMDINLKDDGILTIETNGKISLYRKEDGDEGELFITYGGSKKELSSLVRVSNNNNQLSVIVKNILKRIDIDLYLPAVQLKKTVLLGKNKLVIINDLISSSLEIFTNSGGIVMNQANSTKCNIATSHGKITLSNCKGEVLKAISTNSMINLNKGEFYNECNIQSTNGSIFINNIKSVQIKGISTNGNIRMSQVACQIADLLTINGNINLKQNTAYTLNHCDIEAITSNGSITVFYKHTQQLQFDAKTENGHIEYDKNIFTLDHIKRGINKVIEAKGTKVSGNDSTKKCICKLRTYMGVITIKKDNGGKFNG